MQPRARTSSGRGRLTLAGFVLGLVAASCGGKSLGGSRTDAAAGRSGQDAAGGAAGTTTGAGGTTASPTCEAGRARYQVFREELLEEYSAIPCVADKDCGLAFEHDACASKCGVALPDTAAPGFLSSLASFSMAVCSACPEPLRPPCLPLFAFCQNGRCVSDTMPPPRDASVDGPSVDAGADAPPTGPRYLGTYAIPTGYTEAVTAIGADGVTWVAGGFTKTIDFDSGPKEDVRTPKGPNDAYLMKLTPDGTYAGAVTWGGPGSITSIKRIAVRGSSVVVAGIYNDTVDFDPGGGVTERPATEGGFSAFVAAFDSSSGVLLWVSTFVSTSDCSPGGLALDAAGDVYVAGGFSGLTDFDPGAGTDTRQPSGISQSGFLVKLSGTDGRRLWSTVLTGTSCSGSLGATTVSADGNVWAAGNAQGCAFAGSTGPADLENTVVASFTPAGAPRSAGWLRGGPNAPRAIAAAPDGSIYVGGYGDGVIDFDPGPGEETRELMVQDASVDLFVVKLSPAGAYRWVHTIPTLPLIDLAARPDDGVLILGGPRDPVGMGPLGNLVVKLESDGTPAWTVSTGDTGVGPNGLATGASGFVVVGAADHAANYAPLPAVDLIPAGVTFLSRFAD